MGSIPFANIYEVIEKCYLVLIGQNFIMMKIQARHTKALLISDVLNKYKAKFKFKYFRSTSVYLRYFFILIKVGGYHRKKKS